MKVGVSFISPERARANLLRETPGWDFDAVRRGAEGLWEEALGKIKVEGGTEEQRRIFYTALFHCHYMPHDLAGENAWWDSEGPHYEDFYAIWDTFRTHFPLLILIQPERQRDMVRSLVDTYVHTGWMPDSRIAGANGMTQGGSNGDVVVADAMQKGVKGIDYAKAYEALVKNAEVESPRPLYEGRALAEYKRLGYVSLNYPRSVSRTVEYAYDDFCVAQVARMLGKTEESRKYLERSKNWANVWSDETRSAAHRPRQRPRVRRRGAGHVGDEHLHSDGHAQRPRALARMAQARGGRGRRPPRPPDGAAAHRLGARRAAAFDVFNGGCEIDEIDAVGNPTPRRRALLRARGRRGVRAGAEERADVRAGRPHRALRRGRRALRLRPLRGAARRGARPRRLRVRARGRGQHARPRRLRLALGRPRPFGERARLPRLERGPALGVLHHARRGDAGLPRGRVARGTLARRPRPLQGRARGRGRED